MEHPVRPNIMIEIERASERSLLGLAEHKESGGKVAGVYCLFAPTELVRAAGAIPVSLCGKKEAPIAAAERTLPPNLCPLIKSSYGYAVTDTCPFFAASDFILGETTCDGKKKMFELMGLSKPMYVLELPQKADDPDALEHWTREVRKLKCHLESKFGVQITDDKLRAAIRLMNRERRLRRQLAEQMAQDQIGRAHV